LRYREEIKSSDGSPIPANGTFGNLGPFSVAGRGAFQVDMALIRGFQIREKQTLEFRAETFQILNLTSPGQPNTAFNNLQFGRTDNSEGERIMQFAMKYVF
jgi:hypothetical protein